MTKIFCIFYESSCNIVRTQECHLSMVERHSSSFIMDGLSAMSDIIARRDHIRLGKMSALKFSATCCILLLKVSIVDSVGLGINDGLVLREGLGVTVATFLSPSSDYLFVVASTSISCQSDESM